MTTPTKIEPWMVEAVKEMMVKHLGFGAFVGTNWMLLESDLVAIIAAHAPTIEEWFERGRRAAFQANNKGGCSCVIDENDDVLEVCAAHADWCKSHAPKQPEWEAKEKALRELINAWFHESLRKEVPLLTSLAIDKCRGQLRAILNCEQEKRP